MRPGQKNTVHAALCLCLNNKQMLNIFQNLLFLSSPKHTEKSTHNKVLKFLIRFYQTTFSYFFGGNCRYYPSCSHYAYEAYTKHNAKKATWLTLKRLASCHPFSKKNFFDPVPLNYEEKRVGEYE